MGRATTGTARDFAREREREPKRYVVYRRVFQMFTPINTQPPPLFKVLLAGIFRWSGYAEIGAVAWREHPATFVSCDICSGGRP